MWTEIIIAAVVMAFLAQSLLGFTIQGLGMGDKDDYDKTGKVLMWTTPFAPVVMPVIVAAAFVAAVIMSVWHVHDVMKDGVTRREIQFATSK